MSGNPELPPKPAPRTSRSSNIALRMAQFEQQQQTRPPDRPGSTVGSVRERGHISGSVSGGGSPGPGGPTTATESPTPIRPVRSSGSGSPMPNTTSPPPIPSTARPSLPPHPSQPSGGIHHPPQPPLPHSPSLPRREFSRPSVESSFSSSSKFPVDPVKEDSFGYCLQSSMEAITKRHEEELKALESLRVHISKRTRADREYSLALEKLNQQANRSIAAISNPSPIVQAWMCFLDTTESLQQKITQACTEMSSVLESVDTLIKDKRGSKRAFDMSKNQLNEYFHSACNEVQAFRRKYRDYLNRTEGDRKKLEASLQKQPPKVAEQDRNRKKFVYDAEKLHNCHNNYSLSIINANTYQTHFRGSLLPFSLDTLQERMELQVTEWKDALLQYAQAIDFSQTYEESFKKLYETLRQVEKDDEYKGFVQDNRNPVPQIEFFEFDNALLENQCSPKAEAGKVAVDNLTHNNIKTRLVSFEREIEDHQKTLSETREELNKLLSDPAPYMSPEEAMNSPAPEQTPKHVAIADLKACVKDLECKLEREELQAALIKNAVDELGDNPPPIFDSLGEGVDLKELTFTETVGPGGATPTSAGSKSKFTMIRKGFKGFKRRMQNLRDRAGSTPTGGGGGGGSTSSYTDQPNAEGGEDLSQSMSVGNSSFSAGDGGGRAGSVAGDSMSDNESLYEVPPELPIEEEPWYYGNMDRREAEGKCKSNGDYLVRYSTRNHKYVLTVMWGGVGKHFVIQETTNEQTSETNYRFEARPFPTVHELLEYHVLSHVPVTSASGAIIVKPLSRYDKWSMQHEDIKMGKKLGKGAFGEVWEALLLTENTKVAVKTCRSTDLPDKDKFLQEAEILKQYSHPNIVRLIGVCCNQDPVYIVMELMPGGAFLDFLRKKGAKQSKHKLAEMCLDACRGMEYLESKNCIHRDLAARNCLVGDSDSVKISDFGMSREDEGGVYMVSSGTRAIPIKWSAPEALNYGKYTSASDVWSYGILLWEAFSCGSAPYPGMSNQEARNQVEANYRMPPPAECPDKVYGIMMQCWQYDEEERPTFADVYKMLEDTIKPL